ncbi:MAG: hypothetical protein E7265_06600 [Lachnospiraceae bacterium]|nr:hypothetical protein [Lachnospiraceae bacterium]
MKITVNAGSNISNGFADYAGNKACDKKTNVLFAGNLNINSAARDEAENKRAMARKQAMHFVGEAWEKDIEFDKSKENIHKIKEIKRAEIAEYNKVLKSIEDSKKQVMEEYGIDEESSEHKDLLLLEKYQDYRNNVPVERFSKEEIQRLKELQNMPRTEYQDRVLALNSAKGQYINKIDEANASIGMLIKTETDMDINQPQNQMKSMGEAKRAAEEILEAANEDIMTAFIREGVDSTQERAEEAVEQAQKAEEKKEEQEERLEEMKEEKEEQEDLLWDIAQTDRIDMQMNIDTKNISNMEIAQSNIIKIMKQNNMIEEDLKGIKIDFNY